MKKWRLKERLKRKLKEDVRKVRESDKIMVNADKTRNIYELKKEDFERTVLENITKNYKKADSGSELRRSKD